MKNDFKEYFIERKINNGLTWNDIKYHRITIRNWIQGDSVPRLDALKFFSVQFAKVINESEEHVFEDVKNCFKKIIGLDNPLIIAITSMINYMEHAVLDRLARRLSSKKKVLVLVDHLYSTSYFSFVQDNDDFIKPNKLKLRVTEYIDNDLDSYIYKTNVDNIDYIKLDLGVQGVYEDNINFTYNFIESLSVKRVYDYIIFCISPTNNKTITTGEILRDVHKSFLILGSDEEVFLDTFHECVIEEKYHTVEYCSNNFNRNELTIPQYNQGIYYTNPSLNSEINRISDKIVELL